jgi:hypothetical protein
LPLVKKPDEWKGISFFRPPATMGTVTLRAFGAERAVAFAQAV